ncbi:MAG: hypothetical protein QM820_20090 [Minicystis sp.]
MHERGVAEDDRGYGGAGGAPADEPLPDPDPPPPPDDGCLTPTTTCALEE